MLGAKPTLWGRPNAFFPEGCEFHMSDHFGVMAYVDVSDVYGSRLKHDCIVAWSSCTCKPCANRAEMSRRSPAGVPQSMAEHMSSKLSGARLEIGAPGAPL